MAEVRKICCGIDFSDLSRLAMEEAADLARRFKAELLLVHVHEPPVPLATDVLGARELPLETLAVDLERSMTAWRTDAAERAGAPVRSTIRLGNAADELLEVARGEAADLMVVATHGRTGLKRVVLGSVAERVVRLAPCPVLVVREKEMTEAALIAEEAAQYA